MSPTQSRPLGVMCVTTWRHPKRQLTKTLKQIARPREMPPLRRMAVARCYDPGQQPGHGSQRRAVENHLLPSGSVPKGNTCETRVTHLCCLCCLCHTETTENTENCTSPVYIAMLITIVSLRSQLRS